MEVDDRFSIEWVQATGHDDHLSLSHPHHLHHHQPGDGNAAAAAAAVGGTIIATGDDNMDDIIEEEEEEFLVGEEIIPSHSEINAIPNSLDQIAAENLIYMAQDGGVAIMGDLIEEQVEQAENADYNGEHQYFECQVTEEVEVITDDWVQQQGEDRVEVIVDQIGGEASVVSSSAVEDDVDVPLPTDQDEYTASRPYPCDFCSRRFRKKINLMNHMVAHKNDRPHICNLCGARYVRRVDLLNHLKVHAQVPEQEMEMELELGHMHKQQQQLHRQHQQLHQQQQHEQHGQQHEQQQQHHQYHQQSHQQIIVQHQQQHYVHEDTYVINELSTPTILSAMQHDHLHQQQHQPLQQQQQQQHQVIHIQPTPASSRNTSTGARKTTKATKPRATAKQRRTAAAAAAAAQHKTIAHHQDLYSAPHSPLTLAPLKKEFIHQEDMQLLIDAAQQHELEQQHYMPEPTDELHHQPPENTASLAGELADDHEHHDEADGTETGETERFPIVDPDRPFVCQKCGACFGREKALLSHSKRHVKDQPLECESCTETFHEAHELREHQRIHHADGQSSNSEYEPDERDDDGADDDDEDYDDEGRSRQQQQQQHHHSRRMLDDLLESEGDSKYGVFYCTTCGMSFHRNELLQRHEKTCTMTPTHESEDAAAATASAAAEHAAEAHSCTVCGESFREALDLLAHAEIHTPRYQPFKCQLCGEQFVDEAVIKRHVGQVHAAELSDNSCRLCGKLCRDSRTLMKHSWEHSSEKTHSCSKCGKTFHNKARLKRHMQSHRNKSVRCDVCEEEFPDGRSLMNHRHSHTNVSGRQFPCKECGKTFGSRSSQQIHMRIHTGERPYGCRFCWKAFADGGTLRKHERIHTGEKPYACPVCPRAFNQRVVLREHIRSHHSGPDSKHGSAETPFYCTVCGDAYGTSVLLIQHLIEHSDMNTAMKRQPPTGPRKYKRRRKLKPHEIEQRVRSEKKKGGNDIKSENSLIEDELQAAAAASDDFEPMPNGGGAESPNDDDADDTEDADDAKDPYGRQFVGTSPGKRLPSTPSAARPREKKASFSTTATAALDDHFSVLNNVEHTLQNIDSLVIASSNNNNSTSTSNAPQTVYAAGQVKPSRKRGANMRASDAPVASRPRMIHTQKTRVPVDEDPLAGAKTSAGNKRRTKTMITTRTKDTTTLSASTTGGSTPRTKRRPPRQRNADADDEGTAAQRVPPAEQQQQQLVEDRGLLAAFNIKEEDLLSKPLAETELLLKLTRNSSKYSPDVVNDLEEILRSPRKPRNASASNAELATGPAHTTSVTVTRKTTITTTMTSVSKAATSKSSDPLALGFSDAYHMLAESPRRTTRSTRASAAAAARETVEPVAAVTNVAAADEDPCSPRFVPFGADSIDSSPSLSRMRLLSQTTDGESATEELAAMLMDRPVQQRRQKREQDEDDVEAMLERQQEQQQNDDHRDEADENDDDEDDDRIMSVNHGRRIKQERDEPQYSLTEPDVRAAEAAAAEAEEAALGYTCEMCEAVFSDRAQLLLHVPIHI